MGRNCFPDLTEKERKNIQNAWSGKVQVVLLNHPTTCSSGSKQAKKIHILLQILKHMSTEESSMFSEHAWTAFMDSRVIIFTRKDFYES